MKWGKVALVVLGAVIITALGIDAADTMRGNEGTLLSQVISTGKSACPSGMVSVGGIGDISCVDAFEASAGSECPKPNPGNVIDTRENVNSSNCVAESKADAVPWTFITREQAMQMCARGGKRLPASKEWYQLSLSLVDPDSNCNISSGTLAKTGSKNGCISANGVYDLVGNAWEWVSDDVVNGVFNELTLPESGYVAQVNADGMAVHSTSTEQELFGNDYFWARSDGAYGIIRGGYYSSGKDAGIYSVHADTPPTTSGTAIGFRCVL